MKKKMISLLGALIIIGGMISVFVADSSIREASASVNTTIEEAQVSQRIAGQADKKSSLKRSRKKGTNYQILNQKSYDSYHEGEALPDQLIGNWEANVNGNIHHWSIAANILTIDSIVYDVTAYGIKENVYTISWNEDSYIDKYGKPEEWNPHPFQFTYNDEKDVIEVGTVVHRRVKETFGNGIIDKQTSRKLFDKYVEGQDLPIALQGKWEAKKNGKILDWSITSRALAINNLIYDIMAYGVNGNVYTLTWSQAAYIKKYGKPETWNPQPFIVTYNETEDTLEVDSLIYHRKVTAAKEKMANETTTDQKELDDQLAKNSKLPQTGETSDTIWYLSGSLIVIASLKASIKKETIN